MKIEVGKYYRTEAHGIIGPTRRDGNFFVASGALCRWGQKGKQEYGIDFITNEVLVEDVKPKTFEFWLNVYPQSVDSTQYTSKIQADRMAARLRVACILVKGVEGDGL